MYEGKRLTKRPELVHIRLFTRQSKFPVLREDCESSSNSSRRRHPPPRHPKLLFRHWLTPHGRSHSPPTVRRHGSALRCPSVSLLPHPLPPLSPIAVGLRMGQPAILPDNRTRASPVCGSGLAKSRISTPVPSCERSRG